jgi:glycerol-3-phosphate O-acyltransferase
VEQLLEHLKTMENKGKIKLAPVLHQPVDAVIRDGVKKLGVYHSEKPLSFNKDGHIVSSNFRVLYYYHNRLNSYHLEKYVNWKTNDIEVLKID